MQDTTIADLIAGEEQRERDGLELIPSENYVSRDVLTALDNIKQKIHAGKWPVQ